MLRERRDTKNQSAKLFSVLVLAGATLATSLASCSSNAPDPKTDAGTKEGGGAHFW